MSKAYPTKTHMALVELHKQKKLNHIISQNIDGLHLKSGIPENSISELHGNRNLEICTKCNKQYLRDVGVRTAKVAKEHLTGRLCDDSSCKGELKDSIINFGEPLNPEI